MWLVARVQIDLFLKFIKIVGPHFEIKIWPIEFVFSKTVQKLLLSRMSLTRLSRCLNQVSSNDFSNLPFILLWIDWLICQLIVITENVLVSNVKRMQVNSNIVHQHSQHAAKDDMVGYRFAEFSLGRCFWSVFNLKLFLTIFFDSRSRWRIRSRRKRHSAFCASITLKSTTRLAAKLV